MVSIGQKTSKATMSLKSIIIIILIIIVVFLISWSISIYGKHELSELTPNQNATNSSIMISLLPDKSSPQDASTIINWTAEALNFNNDTIFYRFLLEGPSNGNTWCDMTGWISDNHWIWKTSANDSGLNEVKVQVRGSKHTGLDEFDAEKIANFTIAQLMPITVHPKPVPINMPPKINALIHDKPTPQKVGITVKWIAEALDSDGDVIYYKFLLKGPSNGNIWCDMTGWISNNRWTWKTSANDSGLNEVKVQARDGKHTGLDEFDAEKSEEFVLTSPIQPKINYSMLNTSNISNISLRLLPLNLSYGKKGWPIDNATPEGIVHDPFINQTTNSMLGGHRSGLNDFSNGNILSKGINVKPITDLMIKIPTGHAFQYPNGKEMDYRYTNTKYSSLNNFSLVIGDHEIQYSIKLYGESKDRMEHAEQIIGNIENEFQRRSAI